MVTPLQTHGTILQTFVGPSDMLRQLIPYELILPSTTAQDDCPGQGVRPVYTLKAPATTGAFYCFNHTKNPTNQAFNTWHHHQLNTQDFHPNSRLINPQEIQGRANKASAFYCPTSILIFSTYSPNTSLPIAIADAIGSPKSHRNLTPLLWELIEPHIKGKR